MALPTSDLGGDGVGKDVGGRGRGEGILWRRGGLKKSNPVVSVHPTKKGLTIEMSRD